MRGGRPQASNPPPLLLAQAGERAGGVAWRDDEDDNNSDRDDELGGDRGRARADMVLHSSVGGEAIESSIVLHEDKKYYPDASEVYPDAETLVQDEDTQPLSQPIVAPLKTKQMSKTLAAPPATVASAEFLTTLMSSPSLIRNVAVVGHLHHGKTSLLDVLVEATHEEAWDPSVHTRYTDARTDEQERGLSIKASPVSLVLQDTSDKSYLLNIIDTPGHVNFSDEVTAAMRVADGVAIVVDAVEGVMLATERLVRHALAERLPIVLVVNKVDRLILELKLPPSDAYFKLAHTIQEVNALISSSPLGKGRPELSPAAGNVVFAGAMQGWVFSLESWAVRYARHVATAASVANGDGSSSASNSAGAAGEIDPRALAARLWGDLYFDAGTRKFRRSPPHAGAPRSFVQFVLEPLYKLYAQVLGEETSVLTATLETLGVRLSKSELELDPKPLLKLVLRQFFGAPTGFVRMCVQHVPSPLEGAATKVAVSYTSGPSRPEAAAMILCDPAGPLMVNVVKLFSSADASSFLAYGRVMSGTVTVGQHVKVLGEAYTQDDEEDMAVRSVQAVSVGQVRYRIDVSRAPAGNLIMLEGIDDVITKTATLTSTGDDAVDVAIFRPLAFNTRSVVNIAVEPLNPGELPKVLAGLRKIQKSYPLSHTRVEESGEHVIIGTGELALDCIMHDLR